MPTFTSTFRATSRRLRRISFRRCSIFSTRPEVEVSTLAVRCPPEEFANPNAVKVVTALDGRALYFSRATIPFDRDGIGFAGYRKHLGIYAYRKAALERFAALPPSPLEKLERLEQLTAARKRHCDLCGRCAERHDWRGYGRRFGEGGGDAEHPRENNVIARSGVTRPTLSSPFLLNR